MELNSHEPIWLELNPNSEKLYIIFGGIAGGIGMPSFEFFRAARIINDNKIFVRDLRQSWYQRGLPGIGDSVYAIRDFLCDNISASGAKQVRFIGNSMGGFAALLFCGLLQQGKAIVFAPQTFVCPELRRQHGDDRWPRQIEKMHSQRSESDIYNLRAWLLSNHPEIEAEIFVSRHDAMDWIHANELDDFQNVTIHGYDYGGHQLVKCLRDLGVLTKILNN